MTATDARVQPPVERQARPGTSHISSAEVIADPEPSDRPGISAPAEVIVEHEIRRVPVGVVIRWALALATTTLVIWWAAICLCWLVASAAGMTADVESFAHRIGFEGFRLASGPVFLALGILGAIWVLGAVIVALLMVTAYNLYASVLGGIRVETVEHTRGAGSVSTGAGDLQPAHRVSTA